MNCYLKEMWVMGGTRYIWINFKSQLRWRQYIRIFSSNFDWLEDIPFNQQNFNLFSKLNFLYFFYEDLLILCKTTIFKWMLKKVLLQVVVKTKNTFSLTINSLYQFHANVPLLYIPSENIFREINRFSAV